MAKLKTKSDEQLSVLAGSAYFNLLVLIPTINTSAINSKRLGPAGLYEKFTYPAFVLLPIFNLTKDGQVYFIALRNFRQAAGKTLTKLYLLLLFAIEIVIVWFVVAKVPVKH